MKWSCKPPLGVPINWRHPLAKGLVGYWLMNENGGTHVADLSGNGNHGTLTGMAFPGTPTSGWTAGRDGPALALDGTNDYVQIGDVGALDGIPAMTLFVWAVASLLYADKCLVSKSGTTDSKNRFQMGLGGTGYGGTDDITLSVTDAANQYGYTTGNVVQVGVLNCYMMVFDGRTTGNDARLKLYLNALQQPITWGAGVTIPPSTSSLNSGPLQFGAESVYAPPRCWAGKLGLAAAYARALSAHEVAQSYYEPWGIFDTPNVYPVGPVITPFACAGDLLSSGTLLKTVSDLTAGGLALSGLVSKELATGWAADFASDGTLSKTPGKLMGGTLASTAALLKVIATGWAGTLGPGGVVVKSPAKVLGGDLATSGTLTAQFVKIVAFVGTLATSGGLVKLIHKLFGGDLDDSGTYTGPPPTVIAPLPPEPGTCVGEPQSWMRRGWFARGRPRGSGIYGRVQAGRLRR